MKRFSMVLAAAALVGGVSLVIQAPAAADDKCGEKGQPSCPLQNLMETELDAALDAKDFKKLAASLKKVAHLAPDSKWNEGDNGWKKLAEGGAAAAEASDLKGVQASCKSCHKAWRKQYRAEHRTRPVK